MAKPFALPEPGPGGGGGGASTSGTGPPATGGSQGYSGQQPQQQHPSSSQPPQSAPPNVSHGSSGAFPIPGPGPGHVPSAPIPVTPGNGHYYHQYNPHLHAPLPTYHYPHPQHHYAAHSLPHYFPHGHPAYGHPAAHGSPVGSSGPPMDPPHPRSHIMTPPNSAFGHGPLHPGHTNDELVQALYEALHRCGLRGTNCLTCSLNWCIDKILTESPPTPLSHSPPSASCSPPSAAGGCCAPDQTYLPRTPLSAPPGGRTGGRVFLTPSTPGPVYVRHNSQPTPVSATSHSSSSGISSSQDTPSSSSDTPHYAQSRAPMDLFHWQDEGDSSESEGNTASTSSSQATTSSSSSGCSPNCCGLDDISVAGSLTPSSSGIIAGSTSSGVTCGGGGVAAAAAAAAAVVPPHLDYMKGRELMQEFPGKIPPRKPRRTRTPKPKKVPPKFLEKPIVWKMAVTAIFIAIGCGYFFSR